MLRQAGCRAGTGRSRLILPAGGHGRYPVLVCLAGMSPAVVTETLYALAVKGRPRVVPRRVCIVTTGDACGKLVTALLGSSGAIRRLATEYRLPPGSLQCTLDDVFVIRSRTGKPLSDIRSSADSRDAGEVMANLLADLHSDPNVEILCSIAGGRKTMAALLALALQTCARPGDRLYHVLVSEPFERIPDFFYPPRLRRRYTVDGRTVDSSKARIDLAEVPMIRLGAVAESLGLGSEQLALRARKIEEAANRNFRPLPIEIDFARRALRCGTAAVRLPPQEFALYALYAALRRQCNSCERNRRPACERCHPTDREIFSRHRPLLRAMYSGARPAGGQALEKMLEDETGKGEIAEDFDKWLRETRSRLKSHLRASEAGAVPGLAPIADTGKFASENGKRRGLRIAPALIRFANVGKTGLNVDLLARERRTRLR